MKILSLILALSLAGVAQAESASSAATDQPGALGPAEYVTIKPPFVANFESESGRRLSYVKTDIVLRTSGKEAASAIEYHLPYLRNEIVMLLSRQDAVGMSTNEGKEKLRKEALERIREVLQQEEGQPLVEDLLFSTFVVQR